MNRKATFAKRQRETDLKDHARAKEARKAARANAPRTGGKGPEIAWDEAVYPTVSTDDDAAAAAADQTSTNPTDDSADSGAPPRSLVPTDDSP